MKPQGKVTIFMLVMIVMLSVYYFAISNGKDTNPGGQLVVNNKSAEFTQLRAQIDEARETMVKTFQDVVSSPEVDVEDKNAALNSIAKIQNISLYEDLLETKIMTELDIDDVFVQVIDSMVEVRVYTETLSASEVNAIGVLAATQFGTGKQVNVKYVPINGEDTLN